LFQNAETIRNVFFAGNATTPSLQVELPPLDFDPAIAQYTLDIDGQTIRYTHGPQIPMTVKWPGARGTNLVRLQVSWPNSSPEGLPTALPDGADSLQTQGPWALHRLFDRARITPGAAPERFIATFGNSSMDGSWRCALPRAAAITRSSCRK
jgi:type VI secretion system protein ImpL